MAMESEPTIFIQGHLGSGDHLVCLPIYRHFSETHNVIVPVKFHNLPSVQWMVRGLNVALIGVEDDTGAHNLADATARRGARILRLGMFSKGFDEKRWSETMYEQAGIPFEKRWSDWKIDRDLSREFEPPKEPYIFVHDDERRGFKIDAKRLPNGWIECPIPGKTENIFDYCRLIEEATEIHCIDSCFAILADSLTTLKAKRFVVHAYARPNALPPSYRNSVELLRK